MLISRAAASVSSGSVVLSDPPDKLVGERRRYLQNLWTSKETGIRNIFVNKRFITEFDCELFTAQENGWIKSFATINESGLLQFFAHSRKSQSFNSIILQNSIVIGHISEPLIQISTDTQVVVLSTTQNLFEPLCATLFLQSQLRPAGILEKLWIPPIPTVDTQSELPLLRCGVSAYFTDYHPDRTTWAPYEAYLNPHGELVLSTDDDQTVYSIQISEMRNTQIKMMDPSVVNSDKVLMLFPDYGGPDTVYLRFDEAADYGDWVATLKALSQQAVAAPLSRDSLRCVRWHDTLIVKIGSCETITEADTEAPVTSDLSNTYVDICLRRWTFARTSVNPDPLSANWGQTFEILSPESDRAGFGVMELKLKQTRSPNGEVGSDLDVTMGSVEVTQWESANDWQWFEIGDSQWRLNVSVNYSRTPVLDSSFYAQLQKWFDDISLRSASRIVQAYPSLLPKLLPIYSRIYRAQGRQLEWVLDLATQEIDNIDLDSDVLFRGTSLFTKSMELLLQQYGSTILEKTIGRFIRKLMVIDRPVELNPEKLADESEIQKHQITMDHYLRYLWPLIKMEGIPRQAKIVFRHMVHQLSERGIQQERISKIMDRTLAAFLFLRFYVPALINPQLFNLTERNLDNKFRRTLVLIAKVLQGFANRVRFGTKEMWLVPMNTFINDNETDLVAWYSNIYGESRLEKDSIGIRRVPPIGTQIDDPPPKELPVEAFMGQQLTSPNLVDEWATYSQLANLLNAERASKGETSEDRLVIDVLRECRFIVGKQESIIKSLEEPDLYEDSYRGPPPPLYLNMETSLFGLSKAHLEFEPEIHQKPSFSESLSKLNWLPKSRSVEIGSTDESKQKTGSVRKLMGKFRISRSPVPN